MRSKSAGGVVLAPDGRVLVVNQKHDSWSLPKGHIEEGEDELTAARREIEEESGISDLKLIKRLGSYERPRINDPNEIKELTFFLFTTIQTKLAPIDPDNPEARWVDKEKVADMLTHQKDKEFFNAVAENL